MAPAKARPNAPQPTVCFVSLGCFKNLVDTEVLGGMLEQQGARVVSSYEPADWIVINTCGFIRDAKEESQEEILSALEKKEKGEYRHLAVFGCLSQRYHADLLKMFPRVDILWGVHDLEELARAIASGKPVHYPNSRPFLYSHEHRRILTTTPNSTFIKISEGCDMSCSFCAIPLIRGPYRSRPLSSIVREAESYRKRGFEEVTLISQNSTHYGRDLGGSPLLPKLLAEVSSLGLPWVRVLYLMPEEVTEEVVASFDRPGIVPYFDLPFQHVSSPLLTAMGRSGGFQKNLDLIGRIRCRYPAAVIRSTFIAGFPGETEVQFEELLRFVEESKIEYVGVFGYSDEESTGAFKLGGKIAEAEVEERRCRLQAAAERNLERHHRRLQGSAQEFIPLGPWSGGSTIGRIRCQAPEVDGLTQVAESFAGDYRIFPVEVTGFECEVLFARRG